MEGAEHVSGSAAPTGPTAPPPPEQARWSNLRTSVRRSAQAVAHAINPVDSDSDSSSSSSSDDDEEERFSHRLSFRHPFSSRSHEREEEHLSLDGQGGGAGSGEPSPAPEHVRSSVGSPTSATSDQTPEKSAAGTSGDQHPLAPIQSTRTATEEKMEHIFDWVHTRRSATGKYVAPMGPQIPLTWRHLFKPPIIRQWIHGRYYYGEVHERETSRFELVFDLIYAGLAHAAADNLAESAPSAWNVALLTFEIYLAWVIWMDQQKLVNQLGTDDIYQRSVLLFTMMMIIAYISNIRDIHIGHFPGPELETPEVTEGGAEAVRYVGRFVRAVGRRMVAAAAEGEEELELDMHAKLIGPYYFAEGWHTCLQAAMSFWFVSRLFKIVLLFAWGCQLHNFRFALWLQSLITIFTSSFFLPLLFTTNTKAVMAMCLIGFFIDINVRYLLIWTQHLLHRWGRRRERTYYIPAINIEHIMERLTLLTLVILGEAIMNSTYHGIIETPGRSEGAGWNRRFGRACFAVIVSFMLCFVYFDADATRTFVHALRRHYLSSTLYTTIHFPFTVSLIVMSSTLPQLIPNAEVHQGITWYYSGSLAVALGCISFFGATHASLDQYGTSLLYRETRLLARLAIALIFALLPLKSDWQTIDYLAVHACLLIALVAFETVGKIGAVGRVYDAERSAALERKRFAIKAMRRERRMAEREAMHPADERQGGGAAMSSQIADDGVLDGLAADINAAKDHVSHARAEAWDEVEAIRDARRFQPTKRSTWHTYGDLSYAERGEEDVGNEVELGHIERTALHPSRRWALASL